MVLRDLRWVVEQDVLLGGAGWAPLADLPALLLVVGLSIPISIVGTFILLDLMGRNLNVVSMAGIAFSVGMLVDNAIVVIENIDRHRKMGKDSYHASLDGTKEVWGAVFASTITTLAVFLPVVFIQEEAGQLFDNRDAAGQADRLLPIGRHDPVVVCDRKRDGGGGFLTG